MNKKSRIGLLLLLVAVLISLIGFLQPLFITLFAVTGIFLLIYGLIE